MPSDRWQRVTIRMPPGMVDALDEAVDAGEAPNRSALIRDSVAYAGYAP